MDLLQRLESCKKCTKRKSSDTGIVCSLTLRKPDFLDTCKHFDVDPKEAQKMAVRTEYKEVEENISLQTHTFSPLIQFKAL